MTGGDIILEVFDIHIEQADSIPQIVHAIRSLTPETIIRLLVLRNGQFLELKAPLNELTR